jgi:hypothetical protein
VRTEGCSHLPSFWYRLRSPGAGEALMSVFATACWTEMARSVPTTRSLYLGVLMGILLSCDRGMRYSRWCEQSFSCMLQKGKMVI